MRVYPARKSRANDSSSDACPFDRATSTCSDGRVREARKKEIPSTRWQLQSQSKLRSLQSPDWRFQNSYVLLQTKGQSTRTDGSLICGEELQVFAAGVARKSLRSAKRLTSVRALHNDVVCACTATKTGHGLAMFAATPND